MHGRTDYEQLLHAIKLQCVLVTHNRVDFEKLAALYGEEGRAHWGIILATRRNVYELARRIARLLEVNKKDGLRNQVRYV